jgi:hypothetical protein
MTSSDWIPKEFGAGHVALFVVVLIISALSGRHLFMDGANFVVQLTLAPCWYPADQETPRRLFAVAWATAPARLIGFLFPSQIRITSLLFAVAAYSELVLPLIVTVNSKLNGVTKSTIIILFVSATFFLANIPATELVFALGLTTIFVVYALDPAQDPKMHYRLVVGLLLMASYEIVALSNIVLAIGTCISARYEQGTRTKNYALAGILGLALPFQIICRYLEPITPGEGVFHWFTFAICGIFVSTLFLGAIFFKFIGAGNVLRASAILVSFAIPLTLLLIPDLIGVRTRAFQYAYPSRIYSAGITLVIATFPVILNRDLILWPSRMLDWFGERPLRDLSFAVLAGFCGISLVASSDAYFYRVRLDEELARLSGFVSTESCRFCLEPTKFGLPNLSYPGIMPVYSMAHTLRHPELPPVIVFKQDDIDLYVSREQMEAFMSHQLGARRKKDDG